MQNYHRNEKLFFQNFVGVLIFIPLIVINFPEIELPHLGKGLFYPILVGLVIFSMFFYALNI